MITNSTLKWSLFVFVCGLIAVTECNQENYDTCFHDASNAIVGRSIAKVHNGMESQFENFIINEKNLVGHAKNYDGNIFYYFLKDNSQYIDDVTGEYYTKYEFFESWKNVTIVQSWIMDYPQIVFHNDIMQNMLIGGQLEMPVKLGYKQLGNNNKCNVNMHDESPVLTESDNEVNEQQTRIFNTLDLIPSWFHGSKGVGSRLNTINVLDNGIGIAHRKVEHLPLPCHGIWSVFDNYFEIQSLKTQNINVTHFDGPINNIGEIISFNINGFDNVIMFEELTIKDNYHKIWQSKIPNTDMTHEILNKYVETWKLYDDIDNSCMVLVDMEYEFNQSISNDQRKELMNKLSIILDYYPKWLYDVSLNKIGVRANGSTIIDVPIEWFWNFISNWTNIQWVTSANKDSINVLQPDIRQFMTIDGTATVLERVSKIDDKNHILQYQLLNVAINGGTNKLAAFEDTLQLVPIGDNQTKVIANMLFYAKNQSNNEKLQEYYQKVLDIDRNVWPINIPKEYSKTIN